MRSCEVRCINEVVWGFKEINILGTGPAFAGRPIQLCPRTRTPDFACALSKKQVYSSVPPAFIHADHRWWRCLVILGRHVCSVRRFAVPPMSRSPWHLSALASRQVNSGGQRQCFGLCRAIKTSEEIAERYVTLFWLDEKAE